MICGFFIFVICYGGFKEIVVSDVLGFYIDFFYFEFVSKIIVDFFERCIKEKDYWIKFLDGGFE